MLVPPKVKKKSEESFEAQEFKQGRDRQVGSPREGTNEGEVLASHTAEGAIMCNQKLNPFHRAKEQVVRGHKRRLSQ